MNSPCATFKRTIGVVGGVGPLAGADFVRKLYEESLQAQVEQNTPSVILLSLPSEVPDRTEFLLGRTKLNPGASLRRIIQRLYEMGARLVAIPCNTAHAAKIFNVAVEALPRDCDVVHMIENVIHHIALTYPAKRKVGLLATEGTCASGVYEKGAALLGLQCITPEPDVQANYVTASIYSNKFGIKRNGLKYISKVRRLLNYSCDHLVARGAEIIILGCSELPLALLESEYRESIPLVDPTKILASKLIQSARYESATHFPFINTT